MIRVKRKISSSSGRERRRAMFCANEVKSAQGEMNECFCSKQSSFLTLVLLSFFFTQKNLYFLLFLHFYKYGLFKFHSSILLLPLSFFIFKTWPEANLLKVNCSSSSHHTHIYTTMGKMKREGKM